jgi:hypothetical protein
MLQYGVTRKHEKRNSITLTSAAKRLVFPLRAATETVCRGWRSPRPRFPSVPLVMPRVEVMLLKEPGRLAGSGYGLCRPVHPSGVAAPGSYKSHKRYGSCSLRPSHSFALLENTSKSKLGLRRRNMRWKGDGRGMPKGHIRRKSERRLGGTIQENPAACSFVSARNYAESNINEMRGPRPLRS